MTIELVPLCTITAELDAPLSVGVTPSGTRMIFEVASGTVEGDRFAGKVRGRANADWFTVGADGTGTIDVRALVETHDGALVFVQYMGRTDLSKGPGGPLYIAPRFETSDERYRWLNLVQAVGKGSFDGRTITYEVFEVS